VEEERSIEKIMTKGLELPRRDRETGNKGWREALEKAKVENTGRREVTINGSWEMAQRRFPMWEGS